jgi:4-hydroxymandelate oxidase
MDIDHCFSSTGSYDVVLDLPMRAKTMQDMKRYVEAVDVPFIVKGVLSARDAERSIEAGARGILVSHHHGIMPYSVPPLMVLPEIVKVVDGEVPIFVDCGIESGMDVFKALALGATAVCVGRELMTPLKDGHEGVTKRMLEMNGELMSIMARTGAKSLSEVDPSVLHFWK